MPTDVRIFSGRMNDDDHGTVVPVTDYRYAKNIHIMHSADGGVAAIKNVPGTTEVEFSLAGVSGLSVVGSIEDEENNRVFYFVKANAGNDEILCYERTTNTIRRVLGDGIFTSVDGQVAGLNLTTGNFVTGVAFVYPWLFWTDDNNAPRRVNVERGMKTYTPSYTSPDGSSPEPYSVPVSYKDISIIREPPRYPIEVAKWESSAVVAIEDQPTNQIALYAFQFAYRFLYRDGSQSVLSPYSKTVNYNSNDEAFDTIEITIPKQQPIYKEVDELQVLSRDPATNNWGIIKRYTRADDEALFDAHNLPVGDALSFYFFNDYGVTLIQEAEGIKPFDSVPIASKALEVAQNRLFLGNNLEGYDPLDSLLISASGLRDNASDTPFTGEYILVFTDTYACNPSFYAVIVVKVDVGDPALDGYYFVSYVNTLNDFLNGLLPSVVYLSPVAPYGKIGDLGDFDPADTGLIDFYATQLGCTPGAGAFVDNAYLGQQPEIYGLGTNTAIPDGGRIFKSGSRYQLGIVFYDHAGRNNGVYTNDDCLVVVPDRTYTGQFFTTGLNWSIDGPPSNANIPSWATHYAIVASKNLTTSFFAQQIVDMEGYVVIDDDGLYTYSTTYPGDKKTYAIAWDIQRFYAAGLGYTFAEGDVFKFYREDDSAPEYYQIIGQEGSFLFTSPRDIGAAGANEGLGEIYTPRRSGEDLYYEVGEMYPIFDAGTVDRQFSVFSGTIRGDIYFKKRKYDVGTDEFNTENMSPNDNLWRVWNTDAGRPNVVLYNSKQERRKTAIRWSNQYVAGAKINGLCSFDEVDEVVLEESCGPIQKLLTVGKSQSEGSVMLGIGTNNTYSMYLGETQIVDNSEQTLLATSGRVIGTIRDLRGGYGTNHPESVVENEGRAYWYDEQRGVVVRYAANGLTPISDYKFRAFFNRLSGQTRTLPVIGGFDKLRTEYLVCFTGLSEDEDIEWLNDYTTRIASGLLTSGLPVSLGITLIGGATYILTVSWGGAGLMTIYLDGAVIATQTFVGVDDEHEIEITPEQTGSLSYEFAPKADPPRGEYTLDQPIPSPHQAWRGEDFTLGFRDIDGLEGWTSFYSFTPEWLSKSGNLLLSFRSGKLYRHDDETAYNTFYGTEYISGIAFVVNQPAAIVKWAGSIGVQANDTPTWIHIRTENPYIQSSDLEDEDMRFREGIYYGEIRRDRLSPNATGTYFEKSLKGDKMRSSLLEVYVEFSTFAEELLVYLIKVMWQRSKGHY